MIRTSWKQALVGASSVAAFGLSGGVAFAQPAPPPVPQQQAGAKPQTPASQQAAVPQQAGAQQPAAATDLLDKGGQRYVRYTNGEKLLVGAQGLLEGAPRDFEPASRALDACYAETAGSNADFRKSGFDCAIDVSRAMARVYRSKAGLRQRWTDAEASTAATGLLGAVIGGSKAAASTTTAWVALGIVPIVVEDLAANEPRGKLYGLAAISLSKIVWRYDTLKDAADALSDDSTDLRANVEGACGNRGSGMQKDYPGLEGLRGQLKAEAGDSVEIAFADQLVRMQERCAALGTAPNQISSASDVWGRASEFLNLSLITDVTEFDDTVARLDRGLRTTPSSAFRTVLATPLAVATNIVRGDGAAEGYQQRTHAAFANPIVFNLVRLSDMPTPALLPSDLVQSESVKKWMSTGTTEAEKKKRAVIAGQTARLCAEINDLTLQVNRQTAYAREIKRLNDLSVLTINYSVVDQPVSLSTPTPKV